MLELAPCTLRQARAFIYQHHRTHPGYRSGHLFSVALLSAGELVGVALASRPKAGGLDDGRTLEVARCCVLPGIPNGCSILYRALVRAGEALGYRLFITYTLEEEHGRSLKAAGFTPDGLTRGGSWSRRARKRAASSHDGRKVRWVVSRGMPAGAVEEGQAVGLKPPSASGRASHTDTAEEGQRRRERATRA